MDGPGQNIAPASGRSPLASLWGAPLVVHLLLLVAVLAGVAAMTSQPDSFTTDEGSYELQLRALDQGSWVWASGTEDLDPDQTHYPVAYAELGDDGWVPLAKHPAWPQAAFLVSRVAGLDHAYALMGATSILLVAVAAWLLTAVHDPGLRRSAFWIAGLAPVTVTATFGWAHGASAAASGLAVVGLAHLARPPGDQTRWANPLAVGLVAGGLVAGMLMRSEGVLFAVAASAALVVAGRRAGRSWPISLGSGGAVLALTALVLKAEGWWIGTITGGPSQTLTVRSGGGVAASSFLGARYQGATRSLLDAQGGVLAFLLAACIIAAAVCALQVARGRSRWVPAWHLTMALALLVFVLRVVELVDAPVRGLLLAWPVLVVGVVAAGALLWRSLLVETTVVVLYGGAILATQYADGGAVQWGGRFYAPLTVPLALIVAVGLARILRGEQLAEAKADRPIGRILVVALVVLPLVLGVWQSGQIRTFMTETNDGVEANVTGVVVTPDQQIPRVMWRHDLRWLVVSETDRGADLSELLASLHEQADGPDELTLVLRRYDLRHAADALEDLQGWQEVDRNEVNGLTMVNLER